MWKFYLLAKFREENPLVPFNCNFDSYEIKDDCKHFALLKTDDPWPPYGRNFPCCAQPDSVNEYTHTRQELHTCENCPFYKKSKNPISKKKLAEEEEKKQKKRDRKNRRTKKAKTEETPEERKKRRQKERREARKKANL